MRCCTWEGLPSRDIESSILTNPHTSQMGPPQSLLDSQDPSIGREKRPKVKAGSEFYRGFEFLPRHALTIVWEADSLGAR